MQHDGTHGTNNIPLSSLIFKTIDIYYISSQVERCPQFGGYDTAVYSRSLLEFKALLGHMHGALKFEFLD
ncbi:hypothetical protein EYR41_011905 [Orbilia oligospora]|uniref:Uncharacterized protein n=1 Tax=Orbilia oligospora TaxID=2813651 RepID=A0A8H2HMF0_ORBOL|nr:hypothetical protein EYR41_011905 [Orbilia oligospora]